MLSSFGVAFLRVIFMSVVARPTLGSICDGLFEVMRQCVHYNYRTIGADDKKFQGHMNLSSGCPAPCEVIAQGQIPVMTAVPPRPERSTPRGRAKGGSSERVRVSVNHGHGCTDDVPCSVLSFPTGTGTGTGMA